MDAAISPKNDTTISIRLKVGAVLDSQLLGDFALSAGQTPPANLFLPYEVLRRQLKLAERANLMLMGPAKTQATVNDRLGREWLLEDAELTIHSIEPAPDATGGEHPQPVVEVSSPRIFLEDSVVSAALRPRAVLLSIRDYVKLAAPEPEVLRLLGKESERNGTSALNSHEIDKIIRKARSQKSKR